MSMIPAIIIAVDIVTIVVRIDLAIGGHRRVYVIAAARLPIDVRAVGVESIVT